ncbi:Pseudouridine-5'-phosphate glycosidase, partial [Trinorchestia longiramus]
VSEEVRSAVAGGKPVVALESAIITHGMPSPHNLITAMQLEKIIREKGCTPATVGLIRGKLTVGLTVAQLYLLADPYINKYKISTRDLPYASVKQLNGGTTVSATLLACRLAGIDVFVTGGIGGVHKSAIPGAPTWDVSADLVELGHSFGVAVVCSGIKSILDIPASLEYLETQGTCLASRVDPSKKVYFPDFFTRSSSVVATSYITDPEDAAQMILHAKELGLRQGLVFAVPIPEKEEPAGAKIKKAIEEAVDMANSTSVSGKDVTPFVLSEVLRKTEGRSLTANSALIRNNAAVGVDVALELSRLK